jgi:hypothetical protein
MGFGFLARGREASPLSTPGLSRPSIRLASETAKTSPIRSRVRTVIGRPASICCQCRAEKPNEIISSCVKPFCLRRSRTLWPNPRKNFVWSVTGYFVAGHAQFHHEQNSCMFCPFSPIISEALNRKKEIMECPICNLTNPESVQRCDCGYDFESKSDKIVSEEALKGIHSDRIAFKKAVYWVITLIFMAIGGGFCPLALPAIVLKG